ncbi:MAG: DUF3971 domain-containing protein, partial [Gammaproteobacteria bacterium]|nr:DUF3971 domain-containing protein [Gammaproteobacteria bacterium]
LTSNVAGYQAAILRELNARLDFVLEVEDVRGSWSYLTPHLELRGVRLQGDPHAPVALQLEQLSLGFDVLESLRTLSPQLISLSGSGLRVHADLDENGQIALPGIPPGGALGIKLLRFIFNTQRLQLDDVILSLHQADRVRDIHSSMKLLRDEEFRRFNMSILSPSQQSWFRVVAEGSGEPTEFSSFVANLHVELSIAEAEQFSALAELAGIAIGGGELQGELWLSFEEGELHSAADFSSANLELVALSDAERPMRLDELSATVRADYVDGGWSFGATEVLARNPEQEFRLANASGEYRDGGFLLRTSAVDISRLCLYLTDEDLLPRALEEVIATLRPAGNLQRLQLQISDLSAPLQNWELTANFDQLAVQSWKGAPVLERAAGYLAMSADGGLVQLRSSDFGMGFPTLYEHILEYQEFETELKWQIDSDWFRLRSGPFHGVGDEGRVQGLFSLTAPLKPSLVGPEMELMVGLTDAHPRYRSKYLPFTLSDKLLGWLGSSIGEGRISDGGFIWRGSLRKGAKELRTIQLYFNIADAELVYHPDWPPLSEIEGNIVIDDAQVDVWARRARVYDSVAEDVTVSLRQDHKLHLILSVDATIVGGAEDGLAVVNQSPLRKLVGDSFADWQLQGALRTDLQLEMDLTDPSVPTQVQVLTTWDAVDLDTGPIGLVVEDISGALSFDSRSGFHADDLRGQLWREPISAQISQGRLGSGLAELDIAMRGSVAAENIREWLQLDLLRLAQGAAQAEMHIRIPPGRGARLDIASDLQGMALDLPQSFAKEADSVRQLSLSMPLGGSQRQLLLEIDNGLTLDLLLGEDGYQGGALGFAAPPLMAQSGSFTITGQLEQLAWEPWSEFISKYIGLGESSYTVGMLLAVRDLSVAELQVFGQSVRDVQLNAQQLSDSWQLEFVVPWVQGRLNFPDDISSASLDLDRLDLTGVDPELMDSLESLQGVEGELFTLPPVEVKIAELSDGEGVWGDLAFSVRQDGRNYHFEKIRGNMRGLLLGGDEQLQLDWIRGENAASTQLRGPVRFVNFGDVLAHYDYDQVIETNNGSLAIDLAWPGGPADFELAQTAGSIGITVDEGRFLKTSGATEGTLRVVGIVNLAEFVRRLSLDLTYLFQSGVAFDSITGEMLFQDGKIEVPQVDVLGRSSRFQFAGLFDIPQETIAGELVATLPVASNLPWIAALIGGLPAAAGVYVMSKVFTKQVDRFSSGVYSISGPWGDPEVKFERIFDNTASHQKAVASGAKTAAEAEEPVPPG